MDYGSLMYAAQNNTSQKSDGIRCYKTTFMPPKKEVRQKTLSANVQKFLARQEEEKRQKEIEAKKKRDELLSLRSQDKMSVKRVSTMLKRTKSANKSVMEDAVDDVNTVVTMAGPSQPDEDDYGYVSQEASSFYNKLMDKYSNMPPEEDKFSKSKKVVIKDLNAAKERVKAALHRIEEEETMPRKRKRKSKEDKAAEEDDFIDDSGVYRRDSKDEEKPLEEEEPKPKKFKKPAPPPMDFSQLLKIAEQKQHEPIVIEKKPVADDEENKPMTKKQRLEYLREKEARIQRERRELEDKMRRKSHQARRPSPTLDRNSPSQLQQKGSGKSNESSIPRIPKLNQSNNEISVKNCNNKQSESGIQNMKIPKLADREKMHKSTGLSSSNSKTVSPAVAEELLKKSSTVWSKPCNLSPSGSPSSKVNNKLLNNKDERHRDNLDYKSSSSSHQNLDRRKDMLDKQIIKKSSSTSSELDRRKEVNNNIHRENMKQEIEKRKELMKNKVSNGQMNNSERRDERDRLINRNESQQHLKKVDNIKKQSNSSSPNSSMIKNDSSKSSLKYDRPNGDLHQKQPPPQKKSQVLVDLFGDDFPNEDKNKLNSSSNNNNMNKSSLANNDAKLKQNSSLKNSPSSSLKNKDDKFNKPSAVVSSKTNINDKSKHIASSQNMKRPIRLDDTNNGNNRTQPKSLSSASDSKQRSQLNNDKSRLNNVKPRQFPPADVKPRQFPPSDMKPRQFPPSDVRRNSRPPPKRSTYQGYGEGEGEDEDEYDSEMDDFIDDNDDVDIDVSQTISEIFKYDRNRYKNVDDEDDEVEESNFAQMMKEEVRSTRIGIEEDLQEYLKEKAEKKRAQQKRLQKLAEMKKKRR
ncbi:uncharacterized protein LOC142332293 [Lycorma delicatula]|uniref:uncharacterized protein LOC142332293 n=1 Tax=Lycorma delicatula TaxID=130591 RepID=UPI003F518EBF